MQRSYKLALHIWGINIYVQARISLYLPFKIETKVIIADVGLLTER